MGLPHTIITAAAIAGLWWGAHFWCAANPALQPEAKPPAFALFRSAYGSMLARMMKDSLYSYWHGGQAPAAAAKEAEHGHGQGPDPLAPPAAGRLGRLGRPPLAPPAPVEPPHGDETWLDRQVDHLARLEALRTKRNSPFPTSAAHRRYISASADWRLRLAYQLDPGDSTLYEILNFNLTTQGMPPDRLKQMISELAHEAIYHALGERTGVNEALTGAGAAINLLNEQLQRNQAKPPSSIEILRNWQLLNLCLNRYTTVHQEGVIDGWWDDIPEARRREIEVYANLLQKIAATIKRQLIEMKLAS